MILEKLLKKDLIHPPKWLIPNTSYLCENGSVAYGVSGGNSDIDLYGFCIPLLEDVFPCQEKGEILGFGTQHQRFQQYQEQHIKDKSDGYEYDITVYNIVKFFDLALKSTPNILDSLFVPIRCIKHRTQVANIVLENRKLFLSKGIVPKFRGYSFSQIASLKNKTPEPGSKREESIKHWGFDLKAAYNVVRLLNEAEQILTDGDLNLERDREQLKSIRNGDWKEEDIHAYFQTKEKHLQKLYETSTLPWGPPEDKIKQVLINCLEHHYGSLGKIIKVQNAHELAVQEIKQVLDKYKLS